MDPDTELCRHIGASLRRLRQARGLTQAALAEAADLSSEEVSRIERGVREPRFSTLDRLARVLGVGVYDLFLPDGLPAGEVARDRPSRVIELELVLERMEPRMADATLQACLALARGLERGARPVRRRRKR